MSQWLFPCFPGRLFFPPFVSSTKRGVASLPPWPPAAPLCLISRSAVAVLILPVFLCSAPDCSLTLCNHLDLLCSPRSSSGLLLKCSLLSPLPFSLVDSPTRETLHTAPSRFPITPTFQRRGFPFPFHIYRLRISFVFLNYQMLLKTELFPHVLEFL